MDFSTLAKRYLGEKADNYDANREHKVKWRREQAAVESILSTLPPDFFILDIPIGTGRFIELYQALKMRAVGIDISADMLAHAREKADRLGAPIELLQGDVRRIAAPNGAFDVVVCLRFLNWIELDDLRSVLIELARISSRYLLVSVSHFLPLREMDLFSVGIVRGLAGQLVRRIKTQVRRNSRNRRTIMHEERALRNIIAELDLRITKAIRVDAGTKGGVGSFLYLLEKKNLSASGRW
jgi:SAM-dependent methyltransferase